MPMMNDYEEVFFDGCLGEARSVKVTKKNKSNYKKAKRRHGRQRDRTTDPPSLVVQSPISWRT